MEHVQIDPIILSRQVSEIESYSQQARDLYNGQHQQTLSAAYSSVSGLDQMGASHGLVLTGGVGSAVVTLQKYAEQVSWLRDGLRATERSLTCQEEFASHALGIADEGGQVGAEAIAFPARPDQVFEDFEFPSPVVTIPGSVAELSAAFAATDGGAVASSAQAWESMGKNAARLAESIRMTAWDIAEINKADSINVAVDKALEVADAADVFAKNAGLMSTTVTYMGQVAESGALQVQMAELALAFITDPVEREAAEQAFLQSFMGAEFPAAVESAMPVIRNLMSLEMGDSAGGTLQASMGLVDGNGKPGPVARLNSGAQAFESMIAEPGSIGAGSFAEVARNADGLAGIGGGAGAPIGQLASGAQSLSAPDFGGVSAVGGMSPNAPGSGYSPAVGVGALPTGGKHSAQATPLGIGGPSSHFSGPRDFGSRTTSAASVGTPALGMAAGGGIAPVGAPVGATSKGQKAPGVLAPGFQAGTAPTGASAPGSATSQHFARGMMPMGGMPMGGAASENKKGKIKSVTTAVEEENNLHGLLGDLPPVVPGPIGAWARG